MKNLLVCGLMLFYAINSDAQDPGNLIKNGSFEQDFQFWSSSGFIYLSTFLATSGENSFGISTNLSNHGFIYQNASDSLKSFEASFWVFPQGGSWKKTQSKLAQ